MQDTQRYRGEKGRTHRFSDTRA